MIKKTLVAFASSALLAMSASATPIASDGFDYGDGPLDGSNGGAGWTSAWTHFAGDAPTVVGGVAQTSFTASGGFNSSQAYRQLATEVGTDETTAWLRATVQKTATLGTGDSFGGIGLFLIGGTEHGLIGNYWPGVAPDAWGVGANGSQGETATELVSSLSDVIVKITFGLSNADIAEMWINPADTTSEAGLGSPDATSGTSDLSFSEIQLRAGTSTDGTETWTYDDLVLGTTAADVGIPEPSVLALLLLGLGVSALRRRGT